MRNVIMWNVISLDGFFEGNQPWDLRFHDVVWGEDLERLSIEQLESADTLLFGRRTYEGMADYWQTARGRIADLMNGIRKVVFSNTLPAASWSNTRLVRGDAAEEVARLKDAPGKDIYIFGSAALSAALTKRGLIEEYRIGIAPVLLGSGRRLFESETAELPLQLLESRNTATGCTVLRYAKR